MVVFVSVKRMVRGSHKCVPELSVLIMHRLCQGFSMKCACALIDKADALSTPQEFVHNELLQPYSVRMGCTNQD